MRGRRPGSNRALSRDTGLDSVEESKKLSNLSIGFALHFFLNYYTSSKLMSVLLYTSVPFSHPSKYVLNFSQQRLLRTRRTPVRFK
jgi:hypothetical protein